MRNNQQIVKGIINVGEEKVVFFAIDFCITLMKVTDFENEIVIKPDENGYIWGETYDDRFIAIQYENDITLRKSIIINTWSYIISDKFLFKDVIKHFVGIQFCNGVISSIYPCGAIKEDYCLSKNGKIVYNYIDDSRKFNVLLNGLETKWAFGSIVRQKESLSKGFSLNNSESVLRITFDEPQSVLLVNALYSIIEKMCKFLVFRNNISFDNIFLLYEYKDQIYKSFAEVYIDYPELYHVREVTQVIPISALDDEVLKNTIMAIADEGNNKGLPLSILPENDQNVFAFDIQRIKNICSALEMELQMSGVAIEIDSELKELINDVKMVVKEYRHHTVNISDKTFNYIFGNISFWQNPLAERVWNGWKQHEKKISPFLKRYYLEISESDINKFVKTRNNATHNGLMSFEDSVGTTSFALLSLIYSCTLTRLGMDEETIMEIMGKRLFE